MKIKINEEQYKKLVQSLKEAAPQGVQPQQPVQSDDEEKSNKDMVHAIVNDPSMKKAFYKQPTLWNVMKSAFKGEKRQGTGAVVGKDIARQYGLSGLSKEMSEVSKNFNFNKPVTFTLLSAPIKFPPSKNGGNPVVYDTNKKYGAIVNEPKMGDKYIELSDNGAKVRVMIKSKNKQQMTRNGFNVVFSKMVPDAQGQMVKQQFKAVILLDSKKGSGYYDYKR